MLLWLIDPLEKLPVKRDSSLFLAYLYQKFGYRTFFTHELLLNNSKAECEAFELLIKVDEDVFESHELGSPSALRRLPLSKFKAIFFRLEPPVDARYCLQAQIAHFHPKVINSPTAVQAYSEKFLPLYFGKGIPTSTNLQKAPTAGVVKPLNSFGGKGVEKVDIDYPLPADAIFQPFLPAIMKGERRYFTVGREVFGEVLKVPTAGDFRSNSAWGASKERRPADPKYVKICKEIAGKLNALGIKLSVIDFIGKGIVEINITCPAFWNFWYAHANAQERAKLDRALKALV